MSEGNPAAAEIHEAFRELEGHHGPAENALRQKLWARLDYVRARQAAGAYVKPLRARSRTLSDVIQGWEEDLAKERLK